MTALVLGACAHGQLAGRFELESIHTLFPDAYSACDEGSASACSQLAFALAELEEPSVRDSNADPYSRPGWTAFTDSDDDAAPARSAPEGARAQSPPVRPEVLALHELGCRGGAVASCVELAIQALPRDASAGRRLSQHCARDRSERACEFLARELADEAAARIGCGLRMADLCWRLDSLWRQEQHPQPEGLAFFAGLCNSGNADACLRAASWVATDAAAPPSAENARERTLWYDRACQLRAPWGCGEVAAALFVEVVWEGRSADCQAYGASLRAACQSSANQCNAQLFCRALAGDADARFELDRCRQEPESERCAFFQRLPSAAAPSSP